jgi:hypothetical protein
MTGVATIIHKTKCAEPICQFSTLFFNCVKLVTEKMQLVLVA